MPLSKQSIFDVLGMQGLDATKINTICRLVARNELDSTECLMERFASALESLGEEDQEELANIEWIDFIKAMAHIGVEESRQKTL